MPPEPLDAAIIFALVGSLVPAALRASDRGALEQAYEALRRLRISQIEGAAVLVMGG